MQDEPGTPVQNLQVVSLTSTTAKITWDAPAKPNGVITEYTIKTDEQNFPFSVKGI